MSETERIVNIYYSNRCNRHTCNHSITLLTLSSGQFHVGNEIAPKFFFIKHILQIYKILSLTLNTLLKRNYILILQNHFSLINFSFPPIPAATT